MTTNSTSGKSVPSSSYSSSYSSAAAKQVKKIDRHHIAHDTTANTTAQRSTSVVSPTGNRRRASEAFSVPEKRAYLIRSSRSYVSKPSSYLAELATNEIDVQLHPLEQQVGPDGWSQSTARTAVGKAPFRYVCFSDGSVKQIGQRDYSPRKGSASGGVGDGAAVQDVETPASAGRSRRRPQSARAKPSLYLSSEIGSSVDQEASSPVFSPPFSSPHSTTATNTTTTTRTAQQPEHEKRHTKDLTKTVFYGPGAPKEVFGPPPPITSPSRGLKSPSRSRSASRSWAMTASLHSFPRVAPDGRDRSPGYESSPGTGKLSESQAMGLANVVKRDYRQMLKHVDRLNEILHPSVSRKDFPFVLTDRTAPPHDLLSRQDTALLVDVDFWMEALQGLENGAFASGEVFTVKETNLPELEQFFATRKEMKLPGVDQFESRIGELKTLSFSCWTQQHALRLVKELAASIDDLLLRNEDLSVEYERLCEAERLLDEELLVAADIEGQRAARLVTEQEDIFEQDAELYRRQLKQMRDEKQVLRDRIRSCEQEAKRLTQVRTSLRTAERSASSSSTHSATLLASSSAGLMSSTAAYEEVLQLTVQELREQVEQLRAAGRTFPHELLEQVGQRQRKQSQQEDLLLHECTQNLRSAHASPIQVPVAEHEDNGSLLDLDPVANTSASGSPAGPRGPLLSPSQLEGDV